MVIGEYPSDYMTQYTEKFGKYVLLDKVATGGMAELYRAKLTGAGGFEKLIAIKKILQHLNEEEKLVASFVDEAKLAAFLHHPNIVQIYDFGCMDDIYYIAMEYLAGKDLRYTIKKALEQDVKIELDVILYVIMCLCDGIEYAHTLKDFAGNPLHIIHRDIGPQNLIMTYDGQVKIIDFGIAKAATQTTSTQVGTIKGKVAYMSPEQAGGNVVDHRSDIFSIGIILYELLTRTKMYKGDTFEALAKARDAKFDSLAELNPELPDALYHIVEKALEKDPDLRYQSAHEMYVDIERFMSENSLKVSQRDLAAYMNELFLEESRTEECKIRKFIHPDANDNTEQDNNHFDKYMAKEDGDEFQSTVNMNVSFAKRIIKPIVSLLLLIIISVSAYILFHDKVFLMAVPKSTEKNDSAVNIQTYEIMLKEKKYAEAATKIEAELLRQPGSEIALSGLYSKALTGIASGLQKDERNKSIELFEKAVRLDRSNSEAAIKLGSLFTKMKKNRKAIKYYTIASGFDKENPDIYFNLGYNYAIVNDYGKAREMYMSVVRLAPAFVDEAYFNIALIDDKIGRRKDAVLNLKAALKANPANKNAKKYLKRLTTIK